MRCNSGFGLVSVWVIGLLCASLCVAADAVDKREALQALADREVKAAVSLYEEQGVAQALARLEQGYALFEQEAGGRRRGFDPYYNRVWAEAQAFSGRQDEAWGLAVWIYLFDRGQQERESLADGFLMRSDYGLLHNLVDAGVSLGKLAEMRKWTQKLERGIEAQQGMDLSCERYEDLGPLFTFLPDARRRALPTRNKHLGLDVSPALGERYINRYVMYALCSVADAYWFQGDWIRAAELNQWFIEYARDVISAPQPSHRASEVVYFALTRSMQLAAICRLHGHPEEGVKVLDNFLELAGDFEKTGEKDLLVARLARERLLIEQGQLSDDACDLADKALASQGKNTWHYSRSGDLNTALARARVYYAAGRKAEAWAIVDELLELGEKDVTPRHRIHVLMTAIEIALLDGATHPALESWLKETLESERRLGNKSAEIWLYAKYADFLIRRGRSHEAERIQREVVRLAGALNLPDRLKEAAAVLADIRTTLGSTVVEGGPTERDTSGGMLDIQPRKSTTLVMAGTRGFSRFFVVNPTAHECRGLLEISGPVTNLVQIGNVVSAATVSAELPRDVLTVPITVAPGAYCTVDLAGTALDNNASAEVMLAWVPDGSSTSSVVASWTYEAGEPLPRAAIIDAHEWRHNPFYMLPVYHTLQRTDTNTTQVIDVVVTASEPVRIELYDAQTFELLYVDANGDGDFEDEGDLVISDGNGNWHPDLTIPAGRAFCSFLMYLVPLRETGDQPAIDLFINVLSGDEWTVDSVDHVVFK